MIFLLVLRFFFVVEWRVCLNWIRIYMHSKKDDDEKKEEEKEDEWIELNEWTMNIWIYGCSQALDLFYWIIIFGSVLIHVDIIMSSYRCCKNSDGGGGIVNNGHQTIRILSWLKKLNWKIKKRTPIRFLFSSFLSVLLFSRFSSSFERVLFFSDGISVFFVLHWFWYLF